ncbi:MAG: GerMN domain-containing protein [Cellulosilyticaceae bacterium]
MKQSKLLILLSSVLMITILLIGYNKIENNKHKSNKVIIEEAIPILPEKPVVSLTTYFPVIKDTVWTFREESTNSEIKLSIDFMKGNAFQLKIKDKEKVQARVYVQEDGAIYEVAMIEDAQIKQDYTNFRQYKQAILKMPLEKGNSWKLDDERVSTITDTDVMIETPFGAIKAVEVTTKGNGVTEKNYYGEKIGPIKNVYKDNGGRITSELTQFENNKPVEQEVKVFIANQNTAVFKYIIQEVVVHTNEEPKHFLTDLLKKSIGEEYVVPIPKDAVIENIYMDQEQNKLYVDMSKEYYEMNYGSSVEKLAIQSLVKTVGNYYNVKKVVLTVGGEPYKSEDMEFKEGEGITVDTDKIIELE